MDTGHVQKTGLMPAVRPREGGFRLLGSDGQGSEPYKSLCIAAELCGTLPAPFSGSSSLAISGKATLHHAEIKLYRGYSR